MSDNIKTQDWKIINGFSNYECSKNGDIRNKQTKWILKPQIKAKGYAYVNLKSNDNKTSSKQVHRLIAKTWIENPENKKTVDHINRIRHDNRVDNLQWATHKEQLNNQKQRSINNNRGIWKIDATTNTKLKYYNTIKEASLDTINKIDGYKNISSCALGKTNTAYSYKWEYNNEVNINDDEWKLYLAIRKNKYYVSNNGKVRNNKRILKPTINDGYCSININNESTYVHILVAKLFIDNPDNYNIVNHKNGNRQNNTIDNLEWTTQSGNVIHAIETGLRKNCKKIIHYNKEGTIINVYTCPAYAAKDLNINCRSINKCCKGTLFSCGKDKYYFKYLEDNDDINNKLVSSDFIKKKFVERTYKINNDRTPKKIAVYDNDDKLLSICNTKSEAIRKYNVNMKTITYHLNKDTVNTSGYKFKLYIE